MKGHKNGQLFCLYRFGESLEAFEKNEKNSLTYLKVETRAIQAFLKFFVPVQNEKILRKFLAKVIPLGPLCTGTFYRGSTNIDTDPLLVPLGNYSNFGYRNSNIIDSSQTRKKIKAYQDKICVQCRVVQNPSFLSNSKIGGSHKIF